MSDAKALELTFQNHISTTLEAQGWLVGEMRSGTRTDPPGHKKRLTVIEL